MGDKALSILHRKQHEELTGAPRIRKAEPWDSKGIIQCMQGVMDEKVYFVSEYYLYTERGEQERIRNPDDLTLVAELDGEIVGVLTLQRGIYKKNRHTANLGIAVKNGHRQEGLGTSMIGESFEWARKHGIEKINLEVFSSNTSAIKVYEKIGFTYEGSRKGQFRIDNQYVDDIFMTYSLKQD